MKRRGMLWAPDGRLCGMAVAALLLTGCATTRTGGDAGCLAYAEARVSLPPLETILAVPAPWAEWIATTDDRMTGTCR